MKKIITLIFVFILMLPIVHSMQYAWDDYNYQNLFDISNIVLLSSNQSTAITRCFGASCIIAWLQAGNTSWNQSHADTLYDPIGSGTGNLSWNQSLADTLYASISVTGDNASWNQSLADTLYASAGSGNASWNQSFADTLYLGIDDQRYNETDLIISVNNSWKSNATNQLILIVANTDLIVANNATINLNLTAIWESFLLDTTIYAILSGNRTEIEVEIDSNITAVRLDIDNNATQFYPNATIDSLINGNLSLAYENDSRIEDKFDTVGNFSANNDSLWAGINSKLNLSGGTMTGNLTLANDPVENLHAATKSYVDMAVSGIEFDFFLTANASDIVGYNNMTEAASTNPETSIITRTLTTGDDQLIYNYSTLIGQPEFTTLNIGVYDAHLHIGVASGTKTVVVYWTLSNRSVGGTETLLMTSETSDNLVDDSGDINIHATVTSDITIGIDERLIFKIYANVIAGGSDITIENFMEGFTDSHLTLKTTTGAFNNVFLRQDGTQSLTGDWNAGIIRTITVGTINSQWNGSNDLLSTAYNNDTFGHSVFIINNTNVKFTNVNVTDSMFITNCINWTNGFSFCPGS